MSSRTIAIIDAGPIYAAADTKDQNHHRCLQAIHSPGLRLVIPALVITEVLHFLALRLGVDAEVRFLKGLASAEVHAPEPSDWTRIVELVETYCGFPLGGVDASIVALADRLNTDLIITIDRRHFAAIRSHHVPAFRLLPD